MPSKDSIKVFKLIKRFFSFKGRATRTEWWLVHVVGFIAVGLLWWLATELGPRSEIGRFMVIVIPLIVFALLTLPTKVRRLHDMDCSGSWVWVLFLPKRIGTLLSLVWLGFFKGTPGANRFGPNPRVK